MPVQANILCPQCRRNEIGWAANTYWCHNGHAQCVECCRRNNSKCTLCHVEVFLVKMKQKKLKPWKQNRRTESPRKKALIPSNPQNKQTQIVVRQPTKFMYSHPRNQVRTTESLSSLDTRLFLENTTVHHRTLTKKPARNVRTAGLPKTYMFPTGRKLETVVKASDQTICERSVSVKDFPFSFERVETLKQGDPMCYSLQTKESDNALKETGKNNSKKHLRFMDTADDEILIRSCDEQSIKLEKLQQMVQLIHQYANEVQNSKSGYNSCHTFTVGAENLGRSVSNDSNQFFGENRCCSLSSVPTVLHMQNKLNMAKETPPVAHYIPRRESLPTEKEGGFYDTKKNDQSEIVIRNMNEIREQTPNQAQHVNTNCDANRMREAKSQHLKTDSSALIRHHLDHSSADLAQFITAYHRYETVDADQQQCLVYNGIVSNDVADKTKLTRPSSSNDFQNGSESSFGTSLSRVIYHKLPLSASSTLSKKTVRVLYKNKNDLKYSDDTKFSSTSAQMFDVPGTSSKTCFCSAKSTMGNFCWFLYEPHVAMRCPITYCRMDHIVNFYKHVKLLHEREVQVYEFLVTRYVSLHLNPFQSKQNVNQCEHLMFVSDLCAGSDDVVPMLLMSTKIIAAHGQSNNNNCHATDSESENSLIITTESDISNRSYFYMLWLISLNPAKSANVTAQIWRGGLEAISQQCFKSQQMVSYGIQHSQAPIDVLVMTLPMLLTDKELAELTNFGKHLLRVDLNFVSFVKAS